MSKSKGWTSPWFYFIFQKKPKMYQRINNFDQTHSRKLRKFSELAPLARVPAYKKLISKLGNGLMCYLPHTTKWLVLTAFGYLCWGDQGSWPVDLGWGFTWTWLSLNGKRDLTWAWVEVGHSGSIHQSRKMLNR